MTTLLEKKNNTKKKIQNPILFSYIVTIFLINPLLRPVFEIKQIHFLYASLTLIIIGFLTNYIFIFLNEKFKLLEKTVNNFYFIHYLVLFLRLENYIRKYPLFSGIIAFLITWFLLIVWVDNLFSQKFYLLLFYYSTVIYIKIRTSLFNHEVLNVNYNEILSWYIFIEFHEVENNFIKKNYEFKNIKIFYYIEKINEKKKLFLHI